MRKAFKNFMESFKKDEKGMTLVELLAVIVILAIVGVIAFVAIGNVIENSRKDAHIANAQQIISAAELYQASGGDVEKDSFALSDVDTLETEIVDPWTKGDSMDSFDIEYDDGFTISSDNSECAFGGENKFTKAELAELGRDACDEHSPPGS